MYPFLFQFGFGSFTPLMDHGNMFLHMFGTLLMQAAQLPQNMMEWMRLIFMNCAPTTYHF